MGLKKQLSEIKNVILNRFSKGSYSQEGEDMILNRIFDGRKTGFYVDVGAHHPMRFSNTYFFYRKGWNGINIDAMPGGMTPFRRYRTRDINLELGISGEKRELTYHMFNDPALNSFDHELVAEREKTLKQYQVIKRVNIATATLGEVLSKHLPANQQIDFLSIDVEGLDVAVLQSNDWNKFKPAVILVELLGADLSNFTDHVAAKMLLSHGYVIYAKTVNTFFFRLK